MNQVRGEPEWLEIGMRGGKTFSLVQRIRAKLAQVDPGEHVTLYVNRAAISEAHAYLHEVLEPHEWLRVDVRASDCEFVG